MRSASLGRVRAAIVRDSLPMPGRPVYQRVLLKLSGEALMGRREYGLDNDTVRAIAIDIGDRDPE